MPRRIAERTEMSPEIWRKCREMFRDDDREVDFRKQFTAYTGQKAYAILLCDEHFKDLEIYDRVLYGLETGLRIRYTPGGPIAYEHIIKEKVRTISSNLSRYNSDQVEAFIKECMTKTRKRRSPVLRLS